MKTILCSRGFNPKRAGFLGSSISLWLAAFILGCSPASSPKVVILGSNTIGEELAPKLIAEYKKEHPAVVFESEFKGSTYGFGALLVGRCDLAAASREVSKNELELARSRGIELNDYPIGAYSVAVILNAGSSVTNLTLAQVRDLFTGAIQNWKDVGGADAPVHLCIRHPISGTYLGFRELAMENKAYALSVKTFTNYTGIVEAVAQDAGGIGYSTIELANKPGVKAVAIDGVAPTAASVNKAQYPYERVLRFYTDNATEAPAARDFIQFVQSARGRAILDQMGFVARP